MSEEHLSIFIQETVPGHYPKKAYQSDAAYDLRATHFVDRHKIDGIVDVDVGIRIELPRNVAALILPRSSTSTKYGLWIPNAPGLVDPGFRGDMKVRMARIYPAIKGSGDIFPGDAIAQLMFIQLAPISFLEVVPELSPSDRGTAGWGSSGT